MLHRLNPQHLLAVASVLLVPPLLMNLPGMPSFGESRSPETCQTMVQSQTALSRKQLARLLTIPEGDQKTKVREIVKAPYCKLANLEVRAGATAEREAYPLEFDAQTWLVVLYEGDQYAGYRFTFR